MTWLHLSGIELVTGSVTIEGPPAHYVGRVLRGRPGDQLTVCDGRGHRANAKIAKLTSKTAILELGVVDFVAPAEGTLEAQVSLIKGERMDVCLQKLTELGVDRIQLVTSQRCVVRWTPDREESRCNRYRDIIRGAASQSKRAWLPELLPPLRLDELPESEHDASLAFVAGREGQDLRERSSQWGNDARLRFITGPEGGFTDAECEALDDKGYARMSLGQNILRAETAAIAATTLLAFCLGRLSPK